MSSLASPVLILTTPSHKGATLSSVTSLSINPSPLIQFNLMKPSTTSTNLHEQGIFALHILPPVTKSGRLARLFGKNGYFDKEKNAFVPVSPFKDLVKGVDYQTVKVPGGVELPVLKTAERVLLCKKEEVFGVQDHEIWVGKVLDVLEFSEGVKTGGLINFNRSFHKIADDDLN